MLAVILAALLAGCAENDTPEKPPATSSPSAEPTLKPGGYAASCLSKGKEARTLEGMAQERWTVAGRGSTMPAWSVGEGPTTLVLLPQTNGGSCGWSTFVAAAGAKVGVRIVVVDICGRGEAECTKQLAADEVLQARMAVDAVRRKHRPTRLVLGGASAGGAVALHAAAAGVPVDGVIDISGPDHWVPGSSLTEDVGRLKVPGLLIFDPADEAEETKLAETAAAASSGQVEFLRSDRGHGWDVVADLEKTTLTPEGEKVLSFTLGRRGG